jgi:hypothetical protein
MEGFIIGRRRIMEFYGIKSWRTIQRWKKNYSGVMRYMPNGKPFILESEAKLFFLKYDEFMRKRKARNR